MMQALVQFARETTGHILECGPGLSSVLLGILFPGSETKVWSLEHHAAWAKMVSRRLAELGIETVCVVHAPLADYGDFAWYDTTGQRLPTAFSLVLCDGPPSNTKGGRRGLLPQMHNLLSSDAVILVDDMEREDEKAMVTEWQLQFGGTVVISGTDKPFAVYKPRN